MERRKTINAIVLLSMVFLLLIVILGINKVADVVAPKEIVYSYQFVEQFQNRIPGVMSFKTKDMMYEDQYYSAVVNVSIGEKYIVTGTQGSDEFKFITFVDTDGNIVNYRGEGQNVEYYDYEVEIDDYKIDKMYIACRMATNQLSIKKQIATINGDDFVWEKFDKGYVSFCFDDLRHDIDKVALIFNEYSMPLCIASNPDFFDYPCDGVEEGTFKTRRDVVDYVYNNGGEILAHGSAVVTSKNCQDPFFMDTYFRNLIDKQNMYSIQGIIEAGGYDGELHNSSADKEICERYARKYYKYSDNYGTSRQYSMERIFLANITFEEFKEKVDKCKKNKSWIVFAAHTLDGTEGKLSESYLRQCLEYIAKSKIEVTTYSKMYSEFGKEINP